jgi:lipoyl(octanoyl) transferase
MNACATPSDAAGRTAAASPLLRPWQRQDYLESLAAMRAFTAARDALTPDEIWLVEHEPVFTQGLAGRAEHVLDAGDIPVVRTERGGQVTYHGPGQVVAYLLLDLRRSGLGVRDLVCRLEAAAIAIARELGVPAVRHAGAPGVYVADDAPRAAGAKFASVGLKVSRGCTFHGIALNVAMALEPFGRINPCGQAGLHVTDLARAADARLSPAQVARIAQRFGERLRLAAAAAPGITPACAVAPAGSPQPEG